MASKSLGTLTLDLIARTGGFVQGMSKAERSSKKWRRQVENDLKKLRSQFAKFSKIAAGAGVAAAGAFTIMAKEGLQFIDSQAKMADRIGSTIDDLRAVQIAASDFGIEQGRLTSSLASYTKRLGDAARGTGEAQKAYEALGLEAKELVNLPLPEQLALISERIAEVDSAAERASIADRLMSGGRTLVNLFEDGGTAIRAAVDEVDAFSLSLSQVEADKVEAANDAIGRIPRALEPIRNQIAINLAEPLNDVADRFNAAAKASNGFAAETVEGLAVVVETVGELIEGLDDLRLLLEKVQRFDLAVSAGAEQVRLNVAGQGMGRMQGYGLDNPAPETGPATEAYNRKNAEIIALEQGGNALQSTADFMKEQAEKIRQGPERRAALQAGIDAGLGMEGGVNSAAIDAANAVADSMKRVSDAANDSADADEDKADKSKDAADAVETLAKASAGAAGALSSIGGGVRTIAGMVPEQDNGMLSVRQRIEAGKDLSPYSLEPNPNAKPTWSTGYLTNPESDLAERVSAAASWSSVNPQGLAKVQSSTQSMSDHAASAQDRGSVTIKVVGEDGETTEGTVEGDDAFISKLADALTGVSAGRR